ncbi:formyltetrahydrofolate deformylase [Shouchella miscanthi]|uniref:Formyltetrahydrofolate deformylase n=1 Tax=Shouchella miscanthi TaxID=2598861 RepID=A0ABU6NPR6_9BACI|nr:formyltetrahydrofolate deformylase [Shouchella miscanthi]MED4130184.1 formyltetrahydrofolate deformylase [Shouchella miscanthi]
MHHQENRAILLVTCQDKPGIVSAISTSLFHHHANIVQSDQYSTDPEHGRFFMRVEFEWEESKANYQSIQEALKQIAQEYAFTYKVEKASRKKQMAIFVSKENHCLSEILWKWKAGELYANIPLVISNHKDAQEEVESYGIPFYHIPATKENRKEAEEQAIQLLKDHQVELVVLARYMQILTSTFVSQFPEKIINIHHSFLPAFIGANPYAKAFERGVKLIGATAHYVTDDLDEGPIIEQDVMRVDHRHSAKDLKIVGRNIERIALARAVQWHLDDRCIVHQNKTIVF